MGGALPFHGLLPYLRDVRRARHNDHMAGISIILVRYAPPDPDGRASHHIENGAEAQT